MLPNVRRTLDFLKRPIFSLQTVNDLELNPAPGQTQATTCILEEYSGVIGGKGLLSTCAVSRCGDPVWKC